MSLLLSYHKMKHNTNLECKAVTDDALLFTKKSLQFLVYFQNNFPQLFTLKQTYEVLYEVLFDFRPL